MYKYIYNMINIELDYMSTCIYTYKYMHIYTYA